MAENSDPQVVKFANEQIRPVADDLYRFYYRAQEIVNNYNAGDIGTKITAAGSAELLADGSISDGRTRVTGGDIFNLITALQAFVLFVENGVVPQADRVAVITKPHVRDR